MIGSDVGGYRILQQLGRGGMGAVYLAEHRTIGRKAAIKVLLPEVSKAEEMVQRFFNEAKATAQIRHPGLVDVYDYGQLDDGSAFLVMEMLVGETLGARIEQQQRLAPLLVAGITRQIASAVAAAHEHSVVHRDLKPENVFLVQDPDMPMGLRVKVLDFGIAKLANDSASPALTRTSIAMGTPEYMSPEQGRDSSKVDHRTDIYSLGCIVFEMACGRLPFEAESPYARVAAHMHDPVPRPTQFVADIPHGLELLILQMLEKDPGRRPQLMRDVVKRIEALSPMLEGPGRGKLLVSSSEMRTVLGVEPPPKELVSTIQADALIASAPPTAVLPKPKTTLSGATGEVLARSQGRAAGLAVGGILVIGGIVGAIAWSTQRSPTPTGPPTIAAGPVNPQPATTPLPSKPKKTKVRARLETTPSGATVYRRADGVKIGETPFDRELSLDDGLLPVLLKLEGYADRAADISLSSDSSQEFSLTKNVKRIVAPSKRTRPDPFNE